MAEAAARMYVGPAMNRSIGTALVVAALAAPASAQAITVGAPLNAEPTDNRGCAEILSFTGPPPSCTLLGNDISGGWTSQTPRGNWTITTGRVRTGRRVGPMVFTVIRAMRSQAAGGGRLICCSVPVESQVFTPRPNEVNAIPVNLPVKNTVEVVNGEPVEVVDYLGISLLDLNSTAPAATGTSSENLSYIAPALRQGREAIQDGAMPNARVLVNGEYQAAAAGGGGGGGAGADTVAPALTRFGLSRNRFRAAGRGGSLAAAKVGTTIRYRLSEASTVTFRVRRKGSKKPLKGSFAHKGKAGANKARFTGRLRRRKLRPGSYVLAATSKDAAGNTAKVKRLRFRIVRR